MGEILLEARRLRLLMKAWQAWKASRFSDARRQYGEFDFCLRRDAHWFYWPPPLVRDDPEDRAVVEAYCRTLKGALDILLDIPSRMTNQQLGDALLWALWRAARPLEAAQFAPRIGKGKHHGLEFFWVLKPVRYRPDHELLAERIRAGDHEAVDYLLGERSLSVTPLDETPLWGMANEEVFIGTQYVLMFLLDLEDDIGLRTCADPTCGAVFGVARRNQLYCDWSHGHRVASRNYRQRSKQRLNPGRKGRQR